jgi:hypothetical protein
VGSRSGGDAYQVRWSMTYWTKVQPLFYLRTPQRNRNVLGETTSNKRSERTIKINNLEDIHCVRDAGRQIRRTKLLIVGPAAANSV